MLNINVKLYNYDSVSSKNSNVKESFLYYTYYFNDLLINRYTLMLVHCLVQFGSL